MRCGVTGTGGHWYTFFGGWLRITLFLFPLREEYADHGLEISLTVGNPKPGWRRFYKVMQFNDRKKWADGWTGDTV